MLKEIDQCWKNVKSVKQNQKNAKGQSKYFFYLFLGDKGTSKRNQGVKMAMGNTREMPKDVNQCQENIEGYKKKIDFYFSKWWGYVKCHQNDFNNVKKN